MAIYDRICRECGKGFKGGPRAWYCPDCRTERRRERQRRYQKNGYERHIGDIDYCHHCKKPYTIEGGLQRYCPECGLIHDKMIDKQQSLAYYRTNKDEINPKRNDRRHCPDRTCIICGKPFRPRGQQKTCSEECKKEQRRRLDKKYREKSKASK